VVQVIRGRQLADGRRKWQVPGDVAGRLQRIPQSSAVLGPLKFIDHCSYIEDVTLIFDRHGPSHHLFANDK